MRATFSGWHRSGKNWYSLSNALFASKSYVPDFTYRHVEAKQAPACRRTIIWLDDSGEVLQGSFAESRTLSTKHNTPPPFKLPIPLKTPLLCCLQGPARAFIHRRLTDHNPSTQEKCAPLPPLQLPFPHLLLKVLFQLGHCPVVEVLVLNDGPQSLVRRREVHLLQRHA